MKSESTETFGCCGFHQECQAKGDCVRKQYWKQYKKCCALYRRVIAKEREK